MLYSYTGVWGIGVACPSVQLDTVPMGMCSESWVLRDSGTVYHNGEEVAKAKEVPQEGDILVSAAVEVGVEWRLSSYCGVVAGPTHGWWLLTGSLD